VAHFKFYPSGGSEGRTIYTFNTIIKLLYGKYEDVREKVRNVKGRRDSYNYKGQAVTN
jgi:hypothetical protein